MAQTEMAERWTSLTRKQQSLEIGQTVATIVLAWGVLFGLYYLVPFDDRTSGESLLRLFVGIVGFIGILTFQLHRVKHADWPVLQAVQALGVAIAVFLTVFAALYLSLAQGSDTSFSEGLDHTGALYLTITIFSTVGFGDITPDSELARLVVSAQMLLDLVVIGAVVRLLTSAAQSGGAADD